MAVQVQHQDVHKMLSSEALLLLALGAAGPAGLSVYELREKTGLAASTIYMNLAELERDGLVRKEDARYYITEAGRRVLAELDDLIHKFLGPR